MVISEESIQTVKEARNCRWKERNGQMTEEPVKLGDHAMDAIRYSVASLADEPALDSNRFLNSVVGRVHYNSPHSSNRPTSLGRTQIE
jgi:hypothetical protein